MPRNTTIPITFDYINPLFGHSDRLSLGIIEVSGQKAVPTFANKAELGVFSAWDPDQTRNGQVVGQAGQEGWLDSGPFPAGFCLVGARIDVGLDAEFRSRDKFSCSSDCF